MKKYIALFSMAAFLVVLFTSCNRSLIELALIEKAGPSKSFDDYESLLASTEMELDALFARGMRTRHRMKPCEFPTQVKTRIGK